MVADRQTDRQTDKIWRNDAKINAHVTERCQLV